jgi:hypothetical protein
VAYENVDLTYPNMTGDLNNGYFYSFNNGSELLMKVSKSDGSIISSYPVGAPITPVYCVQFDGVHYWTLERQTNGFIISRWLINSGILSQQSSFSFVNDAMLNYDAYSFCVDSYRDSLTSSVSVGATLIPVNNVDTFNIGDSIFIGPSTAAGFSGEVEKVVVSGKSGNSLIISSGTIRAFSSTDSVCAIRYFYVFNRYAPFDTSRGAILRYKWNTGKLFGVSSNLAVGGVRASCFYGGEVVFVMGNEVIFVNPTTLGIVRHMAIDNLDTDRGSILTTYALWGYSNVLYALRDKYVYYDDDNDEWLDEGWSEEYSYVQISTLPYVYFIELKANPMIVHAVSEPGIPTAEVDLTLTVLDQYRTPIPGETVQFTSSIGSVSPVSDTTDSNGQVTAVYSGTSASAEVEIKATVV